MARSELRNLEAWTAEALQREAASVLLVPGAPAAFRVGRSIVRGDGQALAPHDLEDLAAAVFAPEALAGLGPQRGALEARVALPEGERVLVTAARSGGALTLVLRPVRTLRLDVARLAIPRPLLEAVEAPSGLVFVTGPPGSGKTTTCYGLLEHLNVTRALHIVTVGHHLQYVLEPKRAVLQNRQVGVDAPDMLAALASALAQDPDVLFVGELSDVDVLDACLAAAEAGHLVLAQLHPPTPAAALRRIVELSPEGERDAVRARLAPHTRGVLAQRLVPRADGRGRVPLHGWFVADDETRRAIAPGADLDDVNAVTPPRGETLEAHAARLLAQGVIDAPPKPWP